MSTLAQLRTRLAQTLLDTSNTIYSTDTLDEAFRQALDEYSQVLPLEMETYITLASDGREIDISSITGLIEVTEVWWPYDHTATVETWPPNRVRGFRLWWVNTAPTLFLDLEGDDSGQPQSGEEIRLWYTKRHTIQNLDSGAATTVPGFQETLLILGASGYAAQIRSAQLVEARDYNDDQLSRLQRWSSAQLSSFRRQLNALKRAAARSGPAYGPGWTLDKWDSSK